ncbi:flagellar hook-length control protein FliK [Defluviimonas denitrificans]|nr:flagellar hook-length control protein FliK [Defluviimonas denitrificans]
MPAAAAGERPTPEGAEGKAVLEPALAADGGEAGLAPGAAKVADATDPMVEAKAAASMHDAPGQPSLVTETPTLSETGNAPEGTPSATPDAEPGGLAPDGSDGKAEAANQGGAPQASKAEDSKARTMVAELTDLPTDDGAGPDTAPAVKSTPAQHASGSGDPSPTPSVAKEAATMGSDGSGTAATPLPSVATTPAGTQPQHISDGPAPQTTQQGAGITDIGRQAAHSVAHAIRHMEGGSVEIALSPEELGHIRLLLRDHTTATPTVTLHADRADTLDLMRRHIDILAQDLRDMGYRDVSFSFGGQTHDGGATARQHMFRADPIDTLDTPQGKTPPAPIHQSRPAPDGALDLRI